MTGEGTVRSFLPTGGSPGGVGRQEISPDGAIRQEFSPDGQVSGGVRQEISSDGKVPDFS